MMHIEPGAENSDPIEPGKLKERNRIEDEQESAMAAHLNSKTTP